MSTLLTLFAILFQHIIAYNNGVGERPVMGWSTWYSYEAASTESDVKANIDAILSRGLSDAGYKYICVDEGWILNRTSNGTIQHDPAKYPSGMIELGQYVHSKGLKYGLYSSRGTKQCGSPDLPYSAPGSAGYYQQDAEYMANAGADYFKFDSCYAPQDLNTSVAEYRQMSEYLNATGREMYYDLCGWHWYFGIEGGEYSNSWRIDGDDNGWNDIVAAMEISLSGIWKYGNPYGWNNHDMMFANNTGSNMKIGHQTSIQARAQFSWWAAASSDLIISDIIPNLSEYDIETYTNKDVIAVNQDLGPKSDGEGMVTPHSGFKVLSGSTLENGGNTIYGKMLSNGSFAAVFLNNGNTARNITCNEGCFLQMGFPSKVKALTVIDLWSGKNLGVINKTGDYSGTALNYLGVVEMAMCTGSLDQLWQYDNVTGLIYSKYFGPDVWADPGGYISTYTCDTNVENPALVITYGDWNDGCGGDNSIWNLKKANCSGYECVQICNGMYVPYHEYNGKGGCMYIDSVDITGEKGVYPYVFYKDGTIREMSTCGKDMNIPNVCRCLQVRPFIGESAFEYTVHNIVPTSAVMLRFDPL